MGQVLQGGAKVAALTVSAVGLSVRQSANVIAQEWQQKSYMNMNK